jgi:Protein of unknown function (DUF2599)
LQKNIQRAAVIAAGGLLLLIPAVPAVAAPSVSDADAVAQTVAEASPNEMAGAITPVASGAGSDLGADIVGGAATVPASADGTVSVSNASEGEVIGVSLPSELSGKAEVASSGAVTYGSDSEDLAVSASVSESGVQIAAVLGSRSAPSDVVYGLDLPDGASAVVQPDGSVFVVARDGVTMLGGFGVPWATDASGTALATSYMIVGDTLVQHVTVTGDTQFPVVADPYLFVSLIKSASWSYHSGYGWTLAVTPTSWARANAGSYLVGEYDWSELLSKYGSVGRGIKYNLTGMRDQLICHQQVVAVYSPTKATWNIDEWRPSVGYAQTVNSSCNPGGSTIFD